MYSLAKFASRGRPLRRPLPDPYGVFALRNIRFRPGATSMIAGKPGSFKSVLALNLLARWAKADQSAVYFSADSDEYTVARRMAGILTGASPEKIEMDFLAGNYAAYMGALESLGNVRFEYRTLDIDEIAERLAAYETVHGDFPDVVFIDNLMNYVESAGEWERMRDMTRELDALARETKSHICVLHHASEGYGDPYLPPARTAVQGKVTQLARLVLTVGANGNVLLVACVKNTNGPQDAGADPMKCMRFQIEPSLSVMDVADYQEELR